MTTEIRPLSSGWQERAWTWVGVNYKHQHRVESFNKKFLCQFLHQTVLSCADKIDLICYKMYVHVTTNYEHVTNHPW